MSQNITAYIIYYITKFVILLDPPSPHITHCTVTNLVIPPSMLHNTQKNNAFNWNRRNQIIIFQTFYKMLQHNRILSGKLIMLKSFCSIIKLSIFIIKNLNRISLNILCPPPGTRTFPSLSDFIFIILFYFYAHSFKNN